MITGVPEHEQLDFTARSWLNLSWDIAIAEVIDFNMTYDLVYIEEDEELQRARAFEVFWENATFKINNAISLLQQGIEIALKARIARVSPFLLIAGDPQSWSKVDTNGNVDFSDLRTIDAVHLIKASNAVSDRKLNSDFSGIYDRLRRNRNKIQHLDGRVVRNEGANILVDIMRCQGQLYPTESWAAFRRDHLEMKDSSSLLVMQIDSYARTTWMSEMRPSFHAGVGLFDCVRSRRQKGEFDHAEVYSFRLSHDGRLKLDHDDDGTGPCQPGAGAWAQRRRKTRSPLGLPFPNQGRP